MAQAELTAGEAARTFVVIPTFNEAAAIRETVRGVLDLGLAVVVVDDGSEDETWAVLEGLPLHRLRHLVNLGQGAALQTGIDFALSRGARYVVTFDADGQHVATDIPMLVRALVDQDLDMVLGSRFLGVAENISLFRSLLLRAGVLFGRVVSGVRLTDTHNGLRAIAAGAAPALRITQNRMAHASELIAKMKRAGLRFAELPTTVRYTSYSRGKGQSALGAVDIVYELILKRLFP